MLVTQAPDSWPPPQPTTGSGRTAARLKIGTLLVGTVAAFHASLSSLMTALGGETPLAYTGLIPLFAALIALAPQPSIPRGDEARQAKDVRWGIACLAVSLVVLAGPRWGLTVVWPARLDLVALPIFVTGLTILLFGSGAVRARRFALLFLLLGWPLPYMFVLFHLLPAFSHLTVEAVRGTLHVIRVARPSGTPGSATFVVGGRQAQPISVAATCSGISSFFGWLLLAGAATVVLVGPRWRKAAWIATGLALTWVLNLARILVIFAVADAWGKHVALDEVHPYAGIVLFTLNTAVLSVLAPRMGLRWSDVLSGKGGPQEQAADAALLVERRRPHQGLVPLAAGIAVLAVTIAFMSDGRLPRLDPTRSVARPSQLVAPGTAPRLTGWTVTGQPDVGWAAPYFGDTSSWVRFRLARSLVPGEQVEVDQIYSTSRPALAQYGLAAFSRGFNTASAHTVRLARGLTGVEFVSFSGRPTVVWTRQVGGSTNRGFEEVFVTSSAPAPAAEGVAEAVARGLVSPS
jgi:exosortase/archaeosortase family protein